MTSAELAAAPVEVRAAYNRVSVELQSAMDRVKARGISKLYPTEYEAALGEELGRSVVESEEEYQARELAANARLVKGEAELHAARVASRAK